MKRLQKNNNIMKIERKAGISCLHNARHYFNDEKTNVFFNFKTADPIFLAFPFD